MSNQITFRKWHNETELQGVVFWITPSEFEKYGIEKKDCKIWRGIMTPVARATEKPFEAYLTVTRHVAWKKTAKPHKCSAKCRSAKGHDCQCECGGKNHGAN